VDFLAFVLDFFGGRDLDGGRRTNARWSRPGTELVEGDVFTTRKWHYWPHRRRAGIRVAVLSAFVYAAIGSWIDPASVIDSGRLGFWSTFALGMWWTVHRTRRAQWREERIVPTFLAIADLLGLSRHVDPTSVLRVPRDYLTNPDHPVVVALTPGFTPTKVLKERLESVTASRLGMDSPDPEWAIENTKEPKMLLRAAPRPPERVGLSTLEPMLAAPEPGEVVLGVGARKAKVSGNLDQENPHYGLSVTTGGGKSVTASLITCQVLHDAGNALIADPKVVSLQWAKFLPNVRYADTIAAIHDGFVWLGEEIDRRMELIGQLADLNGNVDPSLVGPRILVVCEELNTMVPRLREHWRSIRDPKEDPVPSPAIAGLRAGLAMGRQGRVHMLCIAQYLTAAVTGGPDGRENLSSRILVRPSRKAWEMLGGPEYKIGTKYPPTLKGAGRGYFLDGGVARAVQLGYLTPAECQAYAQSGEVVPFAGATSLPTMARLGAVRTAEEQLADAVDEAMTPVTPVDDTLDLQGEWQGQGQGSPAETPISLSEACARGVLSISYEAAKSRRRRADFPPYVAEDPKRGFLYLPSELRAYDMRDNRDEEAG
jgi:hypothetical protein